MALFKNLFNRKTETVPTVIIPEIVPEVKSSVSYENIDNIAQSMLEYTFAMSTGWHWLQNRAAWRYYDSVSVISNAVELAADAFAGIKPKIYDKKEKLFLSEVDPRIPETKILSLLKKPNLDETQTALFGASSRSYNVTGNIYLMVKALTETSEPVDLIFVNPIDIEIYPDYNKANVHYYQYSECGNLYNFYRTPTPDGIRYFTKDGRWELWHIRTFNSMRSSMTPSATGLAGRSPLQPIYLEIEQHIEANILNNATLKNGARPSGAISTEKNLDDTQFNRLKAQIRAFYQGSQNAGNVMLFEGGGNKTFTPLSINNKDMDFAVLLKMSKRQLANCLKMPLPLVEGESQTYSNYAEAQAILYTSNIVPFAEIFYDELNRFLMPRYNKKTDGRYIVYFDVKEIPALQKVQTEVATNKIKTGVLTLDEGRALLDYTGLDDGGNAIYQPLNLVQVGSVSNKANPKVCKEKFIEILTQREMSADFIAQKVNEIYGSN